MQYASVYILDVPYSVDRAFDYYVPQEMRNSIKVGRFVVVPFGGNNRKRLAVVTDVSDVCEYSAELVKSVAAPCSEQLYLEPGLLSLAFFMKEQTLCTLGEAIHSMIPAAAFAKLVEYYQPAEGRTGSPSGKDPNLAPVFSLIKEKKSISASGIKSKFGSDIKSTLEKLVASGWITRELALKHASSSLKESFYSLAISYDEAEKILLREPSAKIRLTSEKQIAVLKVFLDSPKYVDAQSEKEILKRSGALKAQLKALVAKGLLSEEKKIAYRNPYASFKQNEEKEEIILNNEQKKALDTLSAMLDSNEPKAALLHGVTGSGKTCVMLSLIDHALSKGKNVILLLPEISLTPQTISIFCSRYGDLTALVHSGLSAGERHDAYCRIKNGDAKVVIGTRSAVFSPVKNLGLIIIDEEQEQTYKSDNDPKYHARDIARYRCSSEKALMLLASATPSLESYLKAKEGKYTLIKMTERYGKAKLPSVKIADMRGELLTGNVSPIGNLLTEELNRTKKANEQSILFLNRRGYNSFISCRSCGEAIRCPNCSISLTYHTNKGTYREGHLVCHMCGYRSQKPKSCPKCDSLHLAHMGFGTQRIEEELSQLVPDARVLRMDTDTTSTKFSYDNLLGAFRRRDADILLGTQMVTKGHDFPAVTLVGVLLADASLYLDDFRASERTFALLTQVIGRAGRASENGKAIIQTNNPDSDVIKLACAQDYDSFYEREIKLRKLLVFPPFCDIVLMTVSSKDEHELLVSMKKLNEEFLKLTGKDGEFGDVKKVVFGPFEAPIYKVEGKCRMRMVVKCRLNHRSRELFATLLSTFTGEKTGIKSNYNSSTKETSKPYLTIDFNPSSI